MVKQSYNCDSASVIPDTLLNDGCEIVGYNLNDIEPLPSNPAPGQVNGNNENESNRSFLELSQMISGEFSELSSEISIGNDSLSDQSQAG